MSWVWNNLWNMRLSQSFTLVLCLLGNCRDFVRLFRKLPRLKIFSTQNQ